ncbi:MAG: ferrous iron transporter B [Proteobacteria bacterium]|nr:ferrous iron transporter B [Pseudomonadota bacterium]
MRVALVGNPNSGKTALFNLLTGSRQKVANYPGVTVEKKSGLMRLGGNQEWEILDLPGAYSFDTESLDEIVTKDICLGNVSGERCPDVIVCVVDATNLRLHLRFALEVRALGIPMILALNMSDAAKRRGITINIQGLSEQLGIQVIQTIAVRKNGADQLINEIKQNLPQISPWFADDIDYHEEAKRLIFSNVGMPNKTSRTDDVLDSVFLHPVAGLIILALAMFLMFQAVFFWAAPFMQLIDAGISGFGRFVEIVLPEGPLRGLIVEGLIGGVGSVVIFLPQILFLFLFILILEESGYLPRAAFLLDRFMVGAGLSGRSFIPLLSSFACAIPGIMATRTIQNQRDRITTILVAPLMTCSARLPVYALLIAAFIPDQTVWGLFNLQGITLFALYAAGIISALIVSFVMKKLRRSSLQAATLLLELPSYRLPNVRDILLGLWERTRIFLLRVGKVILAITVILWVLSTYPTPPEGWVGVPIDYSIAGRIGHAIEWLFQPIGFNWQICVALIPGLAAREVAVSALGTVYAISASVEDPSAQLLPIVSAYWSFATGMSLLVWYIFAPQCLATLAVIKKETQSWKVVLVATTYLFGLAYLASLLVYQLFS